MKKKVVIGLCIFSLFFIVGYSYIVFNITGITSSMDNLVLLHQVEILREHLLIQVKRVQADLTLKNTRHARGVDTVIEHVTDMQRVADVCFDCHHSPNITQELVTLRNQINSYKTSLSRTFTIRANVRRLEEEEDVAFKAGEELLTKINRMVALTSAALNKKTMANRESVVTAKRILFIIASLGPILGIGLAISFIMAFTRPLNELLRATRKISGGDLDYRIGRLKDEFGEVAASFNAMASSLKEQIENMQRIEQMTVVGQMATMLAHEIKNPLAGIKASMQVLHEEVSLAEEDKTILLKVIDEVRRIELLLKSLLDFSRPSKPQFMAVDLNSVLTNTLKYSFKHPAKVEVVADLDKDLPVTMADPGQMQQVFLNLLINAADAMPEGGTIAVNTSYHDSRTNSLRVEISDTGKGIEKEMMERIFEPFFSTKAKGTGLGLAICKRIVEEHQGTITASQNASVGSTFNIILPVRPEAGA